MGVGGIGIWQLLIVLVIVLLLFGTKKLRNLGGDLGSAIKNFKNSMKSGESGEGDEEQKEELVHKQPESNPSDSKLKDREKA